MEGAHNISKKLMTIQSKLNAPKGQHNDFGHYDYRSNEDILNALKPLLLEQDTTIVQSDEMIQFGDRYYIKATSTISCINQGGDISNTAYARESETKKGMDAAQITGSASSYARKYSLNGLFAIDDSRDADTTDNREQKEDDKPPKKDMPWLNEEMPAFAKAREAIGKNEKTLSDIRKVYKVSRDVAEKLELPF